MTFTPVAPSALRAGRHARPEADDETIEVLARPAPRPAPEPGGEAAAQEALAEELLSEELLAEEALAEQHTQRIGPLDQLAPDAETAPDTETAPDAETAPVAIVPAAEPAKAKPRAGKGNQSTAADLALLRRHSALRARVIAAVVVPFVLYTTVMYLLSWLDVYFIWVWIPLVSAGVLAGSFLDVAHRKHPPAT